MNTSQMVLNLKSAGEDFEWYPTTNAMMDAVACWIPSDAKSIMDIGAGDGRVLTRLSDKCRNAILYSIEKSQVLIQAQPANVVPVGTELFEQNLSALQVDYVFSNPPFSVFEDWVYKIVEEAYAKKAYVVMPQRWTQSKAIEDSIARRGAVVRVIHRDDFLNAERNARAAIEIVEFSFPKDRWGSDVKDPFEIWFDQNVKTFDKEEEFHESVPGSDVAKRFIGSSVVEMVAAYRIEYDRLVTNYRGIFKLDAELLRELGIEKDAVRNGLKLKISGLKTKYWEFLFDNLDAITSRLSTASKKTLLRKLTEMARVEFTENNAYSVVLWSIKNANQYFDEQLVDLFFELSVFDGVLNYKSNVRAWIKDGWRYGNSSRVNTHYALDYRIVVRRTSAICVDKYRKYMYPGNLHDSCHELIADVVAVLSNLGFQTLGRSRLRSWESGKWQNFHLANEEVLFQVKAFQNGNLHFRFMPDAIMALNVNAARLLKWVRSEEDVVSEMGYTPEEAKKHFRRNMHILPVDVKLLTGG